LLGWNSQPKVGREQGLKDVASVDIHIQYMDTIQTDGESNDILKAILHGYYKNLKAFVGQQHNFSVTK